jgi:hypothetical protein
MTEISKAKRSGDIGNSAKFDLLTCAIFPVSRLDLHHMQSTQIEVHEKRDCR